MKILEKYFYRVLIGLLLIIIIIEAFKRCGRDDVSVVTNTSDSIQYWRNREGQLIASLKQKEEYFAAVEKRYLDSIAKLHNTNPGKIKEAVGITLRGDALVISNNKPVIVYRDTGNIKEIKSASQVFLSPYYFASVTIGDSSFMSLSTYDTVSMVVKEVKEGGLFNRKRYLQYDIKNSNPYNVITGIKAYRVKEAKPKKIGIGIQAGYGLSNSLTPAPYIGVGISYNIIRL